MHFNSLWIKVSAKCINVNFSLSLVFFMSARKQNEKKNRYGEELVMEVNKAQF